METGDLGREGRGEEGRRGGRTWEGRTSGREGRREEGRREGRTWGGRTSGRKDIGKEGRGEEGRDSEAPRCSPVAYENTYSSISESSLCNGTRSAFLMRSQ